MSFISLVFRRFWSNVVKN